MTMSNTVSSTVYFDNAATTAPLPCAVETLQGLTTSVMGNASSAHRRGSQAREVLDRSHESVGRYFNVPPSHIIFTSGGTESNNLAIWGSLGGLAQAFQWLKTNPGPTQGKLITSVIEHPASTKVFELLEGAGAPVAWVGVDREGLLDLTQLEKELSERTKVVSIHHAQNEIGVLQNIREISQLVRSKQPDAIIHIDAIQSFMKVPLNLEELGVDMASISGHKIGGPKGVGALILGRRFENRNPKVGTFIQGSEQQAGARPGTVPVPVIGSMVAAIEWGQKHFEENRKQLLRLRERLISKLPDKTVLNGPSPASPQRVPQTVNFSIPGLPSSVTVEALSAKGFCVSAGSACHSSNPKPNETLMEMGVGRERALSAVRVSFSHSNTIEEVNAFIPTLDEVIRQYL